MLLKNHFHKHFLKDETEYTQLFKTNKKKSGVQYIKILIISVFRGWCKLLSWVFFSVFSKFSIINMYCFYDGKVF